MAPETPAKTMSSRLLTMKFMQRAANSSNASSPSTPKSEDQSSKRRKVSESPAAGSIDYMVDQAAVKSALAQEERKVEEALIKRAEEAGDARWVLDVSNKPSGASFSTQKPMNIVPIGFAQIDSGDDDDDDGDGDSNDRSHGHTQPFRRFNMDKKQKKKSKEDTSDDSDSDDNDSSDSSEEGDSGRRSYGQTPSAAKSETTRQNINGKRKAEKTRASQYAEKRRKKDVKLNSISSAGGLSSISGGGGPAQRTSNSMTCHSCGKPGHKAADCKNARRNRR